MEKINKIQVIGDVLYNIVNDIDLNINTTNINIVEGEIVSIKPSGKNQYITIKNGEFQMNCISWGNIYEAKEGDTVEIVGKLMLLKKNLSLYYNIKKLQKIGTGNYVNSFVELKKKVIDLGWCNRKREIEKFPYNIGIVSALEGAAIQDILQTFRLDNLHGKVIIKNAIVQGKQCPSSVIDGIKYFNSKSDDEKVDLLLITRGGGSNEDLIGFSDFKLLEEISKSDIITISAVGHQIDNQLSDIVADYYFATPSIAAKFIVEKQKSFIEIVKNTKSSVENILNKFNETKEKFNKLDAESICKNYEKVELSKQISKYRISINEIFKKYNDSKVLLYNNISKIKQTIYHKEKEINVLDDLIEATPKKVQIILQDGRIDIQYKILSFEKYN